MRTFISDVLIILAIFLVYRFYDVFGRLYAGGEVFFLCVALIIVAPIILISGIIRD